MSLLSLFFLILNSYICLSDILKSTTTLSTARRNGIMFNLIGYRDVRIYNFTITKGEGGKTLDTVMVYIKKMNSGIEGSENSASDWKLMSSQIFNHTTGLTQPIIIKAPRMFIGRRDTIGVYIVFKNGGTIRMLKNTAKPEVLNDGSRDLILQTGKGVTIGTKGKYFTGTTFTSNMQFIGYIKYDNFWCDWTPKIMNGDGGITLHSKREHNGTDYNNRMDGQWDVRSCFRMGESFTCNAPIINMKYESIDYDAPKNEYLEVQSNTGLTPESNFKRCKGGKVADCNVFLDCYKNFQDGRILYKNTTYMFWMRNGPWNNEQACDYGLPTQRYTALNTYTTIMCGCHNYVDIEDNKVNTVSVEIPKGGKATIRNACFQLADGKTCTNPRFTVEYENNDYSSTDTTKQLKVDFIDDGKATNLATLTGIPNSNTCGEYVVGLKDKSVNGAAALTKKTNAYKIRLTNGANAGANTNCANKLNARISLKCGTIST